MSNMQVIPYSYTVDKKMVHDIRIPRLRDIRFIRLFHIFLFSFGFLVLTETLIESSILFVDGIRLSTIYVIMISALYYYGDPLRSTRVSKKNIIVSLIIIYFLMVGVLNSTLPRALSVTVLYTAPFIMLYCFRDLTMQSGIMMRWKLKVFISVFIVVSVLGLFTIESPEMLFTRGEGIKRFAGIFLSDMIGGYFNGIYFVIFIALFWLLREKKLLILAFIALTLTIFSQTRAYIISAILAGLLIFLPLKLKTVLKISFALILLLIVLSIFEFNVLIIINNVPGLEILAVTIDQYRTLINEGMITSVKDFSDFNLLYPEGFEELRTFADRFYFAFHLVSQIQIFPGHGFGSAGFELQSAISQNLDITHSDPITIAYEMGILFVPLYYVFYIKVINVKNLFRGYNNILLGVCTFEFLSAITSSNLHLALHRIILFWGVLLIINILFLKINHIEELK